MLFTLCLAAFAASPKTRELPFAGEYVTVSDDEGNVYTVWVEAKLYRARTPRSSDGSLSDGRYSEGDQIELTAKITNTELGLNASAVGGILLLAEKYKLAQLVTNAMAPYVGKTIDAGVTLYSILAPWIADYNGSIGNTGFKVTATFEWTHFRHQIQGIDLWDWGFVGVRVEGYQKLN